MMGNRRTSNLLLALAVLLHCAWAFVLPPFTPTSRPVGAVATLARRVHSSAQLRRRSAVGDNGGDKKETSSNSGERRKRLMEDTLFSLETRAQQLAREAEQRRRMKEEGAAGEGEVATVATASSSSSTHDEEEEQEEEEGMGKEHSDAVLWELEWLPFMLRQALARSEGVLTKADMQLLKEEVFGIDSFYVTGEDGRAFPKCLLFRGNLRGDEGMARVHKAMASLPGLASRVSLFLIELPQERATDVVEYGLMAAPCDLSPVETSPVAPLASLACLGASGISALAFAYAAFVGNPQFWDSYVSTMQAPEILAHVLPVAGGILGTQVIHELAHVLVGRSNGVKLSWPLFLPSMEMGLFGAITPLASFPKDRRALFDTALAGPLVGLAASLLLFSLGLHLTPLSFSPDHAALSDASVLNGAATATADAMARMGQQGAETAMSNVDLPFVPSSLIHQSFLLSSLAHALLPHLSLVSSDAVALHPLALVGLCGAIASAFAALPIGRLDGGRAFSAAFGPRKATRVGTMVLLGQAVLCVLSRQGLPLLFLWGMVVATLQKRPEVAPMDDVTEVDEGRQALLVGALFLVLLIILPYPAQ